MVGNIIVSQHEKMLIIRLVGVLIVLFLLLSAVMYIFTRERRYWDFAWAVVRFSALFLSVFAAIYVLERYILTGWKVLL